MLVSTTLFTSANAQGRSSAPDSIRPVKFLDEVLVTGARFPRAYYESPQALSFVLRGQLRELAPTVIGDAFQLLPGVDNSKDSPWEQRPVVRGLSGQRVLVLMDGSPINSARGNGPHPSLVDASQVERIEVVRGPGSVAYGSDALGGVINIITRQGPFAEHGHSFRGSATLGGSTVDRQRTGYLELMPQIGRWSAFISSGARRAENFDSPDGEVRNSGFSDYNALANVRYDFTEKTSLKAGYQIYRGSNIGIPGLSFETPGAMQDFEFAFYDRDLTHLTLDHGYRSSWLAGTMAKIYWQQERRDFFSDQQLAASMFSAFGVPPRTGAQSATTLQDRYLDLDTYGFQTQLTTVKTPRYRLSAGLDALRDVTDGDNVRLRTYYDAGGNPVPGPGGSPATAVRTTASVPDGRFDNYGGFVQSEWYLHPQWTLSAGGRYTHYRYRTDFGLAAPRSGAPGSTDSYFQPQKVDDDALSGSIGLVFAPIQDLHLSANVATGYRQPNAQDLFFEGPASVGFVIGNPGLEPERSVSYDAGMRWGPGALAISGNLFYSTYEGLIDAIPVPSPPQASGQPSFQYTNIAQARIWGGEAEGEWRFLPRWSARAAVAGAVGDITSSEAIRTLYGASAETAPLTGVPPFKGSLGVRFTDVRQRFWIEPSARYSWRTNRLPLPTPGVGQLTDFKKEWLVGDVFAGVRIVGSHRLLLGVRNVTDRAYRQPLGSLDEPGISLVGSVSTEF
ncbi:MAG TPA: TonB-dependent receptor [Candidatus Limnocylindria bacterium]|nr:TonB-dependent receptor [Candidatus Limnocylindria bacterium]